MRVWQINVVYESGDDVEEDDVRIKLEQILEGSGFGVAVVERDEEQEDAIKDHRASCAHPGRFRGEGCPVCGGNK